MLDRTPTLYTLATLLLLGCAPSAPAPAAPVPPLPAPQEAASPAAPATPAVQRGETLVYALSGTLANCYSLEVQARHTNASLDHVYETLLRFDYLKAKDYRADLEVKPRLAERWERPNATTYIFHLRKGVKWHDGESFTADDVIATAQGALKGNFRSAATWRPFANIEKVDDYTLRMTTRGPSPLMLVTLAHPSDAHILPRKHLDAGTMPQNCVGTGPFKVSSWDKTKMEQAAFGDFYLRDESGGKLPYLAGIRIIYGMNDSAQEAALASGEIDVYQFLNVEEFEAFRKKVPDLKTEPWTHHNSFAIFYNLNRKPFDDANVRKAVNLLVDRQKVHELLHAGKGKIGLPVVPAVKEGWGISQEEILRLPGFRKDKTEDVAEARRLLAGAGLPDGFTFDLVHTQIGTGARFAQAMPGLLKSHGIGVRLQSLDTASATRERIAGNFDGLMWVTASFDPLLRTDEFFYTKGSMAKAGGIPDRGQDALIDQLRVEFDLAKQKDLVRKIQEIVLNNYWTVPLGDPTNYSVMRGWVNNFRPSIGEPVDVTATSEYLWLEPTSLPSKRKG